MADYYRLKDKYILRGWEKLPYAIVDTDTNNAEFIDAEHMNALKWCGGGINITIPLVSDDERAIIHEYAERGIVEPCEPGHSISKEQEYRLYPARYIRSVQWSITGRCNFKCRHCYLSASTGKYGELSHDTVMNIITQLEACGITGVKLTGGEPLVRSDFWEIVDSLLEHGIRIPHIYSNGVLVNENFIDGLTSRGLNPLIIISYDGKGWHDWLRGVKGAEEMAERAIKLCADNGLKVVADMCLHRHNKHTIRESVNHMASLGAYIIRIGGIQNTGSWKDNNEADNTLSIDELFRLYYDYLPHFFEDNLPVELWLGAFLIYNNELNEFYIPGYMEKQKPDDCLCCSRTDMYISPEGRVMPCMPMAGTILHDRMPLIQEEGLAHCINDSFWFNIVNLRVRDYWAANEECRNCEYASVCSPGCRATALEYEPDNYMAKSPTLCTLIKGKWPEKIIDLMKRIRPEIECVNLKKK